jgi:hypothetical protein
VFYPSFSVMRDTSALAALAVDDIRDGKFDSFSGAESNVIPGGAVEKIVCCIWNYWRSPDLFIPYV